MPHPLEGTPELSRTTAILLVFQADGQHEKITDVYVGLIVHRVESHLYTLDQILDFIRDIEGDLQVVRDTLKASGDPGKRHAICLFVSNYGGTMCIPMDPPYCLIYPTSYVRDVDPDHFDTHNNPTRTCLHHCICCTTLQFANDDPDKCRKYSGNHLILPHGAQYNDRLFPVILKLWNHQELLMGSLTKEPFPMELVGISRWQIRFQREVTGTPSYILTWICTGSGSMGFTSLCTGGRFQCHLLLRTGKPGSPK